MYISNIKELCFIIVGFCMACRSEINHSPLCVKLLCSALWESYHLETDFWTEQPADNACVVACVERLPSFVLHRCDAVHQREMLNTFRELLHCSAFRSDFNKSTPYIRRLASVKTFDKRPHAK